MALDATKTLVSLADAKRYLGKADTDTADDRLIDAAVIQASVIVRKALGCDIVDAVYSKELHDGDGGKILLLNNWPLTEVRRVAIGRDTALRATYTGAGTHATARVANGSLYLRSASTGVWTDASIVLSDYATIDLLAAQVSATSGWEGTAVSGFGGWPSADLVTSPAKDAKDEYVDLEVPEECEADYEIQSDDYAVLYNAYGWTWGHRNVCVDYRAGWTREDLPEPLQSLALEMTSLLYKTGKRDPTLQSESIGSYSYSVGQQMVAKEGLSQMMENKLAPYRRLIIGGVLA